MILEDRMFRNKPASSTALRWGILLVVVLALLVTTFALVNGSLVANASLVHSNYQIASVPCGCVQGASSPSFCPHLIKPLGSWGG
jgi:hypothetical protein